MLSKIGIVLTTLILIFSILIVYNSLNSLKSNEVTIKKIIYNLNFYQLIFSLLTFLILLIGFVTSDFSLINVFENSHTEKPLFYKISGVWGNHEGSLLLWINILVIFSFLFFIFNNKKNKKNYTKLRLKKYVQKIKKNNSIFNFLYKKIFSFIKKNQKYLFHDHYFSKKNYFFICLRLLYLPFQYDEFNFEIRDFKKNRYFLKSELRKGNKTKFNNFFNDLLYGFMPSSYLENYYKIVSYSNKINFNPKIIFTSNAHLSNDTFKIWSAEKVKNGSKLIASDHGLQFDNNYSFNYGNIYFRYIKWVKTKNKNFTNLPPNKFLDKNNYFNKDKNKILVLLPVKYKNKRHFLHRNGHDIDDYNFVKKNLIYCFKKYLDNFYFRIHPSCENKKELEKMITKDFGKNKIDKEEKFSDSIKKYKMIIDTDLETPFLETFLSNIPVISLVNIELIQIDKNSKSLLKDMIKNKIIFSEFISSKKYLREVIENPYDWWESKRLVKLKKKLLKTFSLNNKNNLNKWTVFFENIKV